MITVEEFEIVTGIEGSSKKVAALIPIVEEHIKSYCNIDELPEGDYKLNAINMIKYQLNKETGVQSESLSRHSITYTNDYPVELTKGLRRRLRW